MHNVETEHGNTYEYNSDEVKMKEKAEQERTFSLQEMIDYGDYMNINGGTQKVKEKYFREKFSIDISKINKANEK